MWPSIPCPYLAVRKCALHVSDVTLMMSIRNVPDKDGYSYFNNNVIACFNESSQMAVAKNN